MTWKRAGLLCACIGMLLGTACLEDDKDACGKGQKYENKVCVDDTGDGDGNTDGDGDGNTDGDGDGNADGDGDGDTDGDGGEVTDWGEPCTSVDDCTGGTNYCAKQPGQAEGFCTKTDCTTDNPGDVCPEGWSCFDLSQLGVEGQPTFCRAPT